MIIVVDSMPPLMIRSTSLANPLTLGTDHLNKKKLFLKIL